MRHTPCGYIGPLLAVPKTVRRAGSPDPAAGSAASDIIYGIYDMFSKIEIALCGAMWASRPTQRRSLSAKRPPLCAGADAYSSPCWQHRFCCDTERGV